MNKLTTFLILLLVAVPASLAATFIVNSTLDTADALPEDGTCATAGAVCTLRFAIEESNAFALQLPTSAGHVLGFGGSSIVVASSDHMLRVDFVGIDPGMPGISGLEVARGIKQSDAAPPVLLLSGWVIQQEEPKVREAGVDYVLVKPCTNKTLLETVQLALQACVAVGG